MNKELIKKYKAEFDHWLNGGEILVSDNGNLWEIPDYNVWTDTIVPYYRVIINDKYVEFRKALAEGKTVEVLHYTGYKEFDQNPWKLFAIGVSIFDKPVENYRIKPEKPKFEVGDWVIIEGLEPFNGIFKILGHIIIEGINCYDVGFEIKVPETYITLWQPKEGEWCWFWDEYLNKPQLEQFNKMIVGFECGISYFLYAPKCNKFINGQIGSKFCEPFIGNLPDSLKDKK